MHGAARVVFARLRDRYTMTLHYTSDYCGAPYGCTSTFEICDAFERRFSEVLVPRSHWRRNGASRVVRRSLGSPERASRASHVEGIDPFNVRHTTNNSKSVSLSACRTLRVGGGERQRGIVTRERHFNTASIELTVDYPLL